MASAAAFDRYGVFMFVALETSREVAVIDAHDHVEFFRIKVGRAPQALAVSADGYRLYVSNFMDRTVGVYDLSALINQGQWTAPLVATLQSGRHREALGDRPQGQAVLLRRARHAPRPRGVHELRELPQRRRQRRARLGPHRDGRGPAQHRLAARPRGMAQGFLHWSANFDEVQDFEGQIRALAGGTGLMTDAAFNPARAASRWATRRPV